MKYRRCWYCGALHNPENVTVEATLAALTNNKPKHACCEWCYLNNLMRIRMEKQRRDLTYAISKKGALP